MTCTLNAHYVVNISSSVMAFACLGSIKGIVIGSIYFRSGVAYVCSMSDGIWMASWNYSFYFRCPIPEGSSYVFHLV